VALDLSCPPPLEDGAPMQDATSALLGGTGGRSHCAASWGSCSAALPSRRRLLALFLALLFEAYLLVDGVFAIVAVPRPWQLIFIPTRIASTLAASLGLPA